MTEHEQIPTEKNLVTLPTILIVEHDLPLKTLLVDALQMEFDCVAHSATTGRSALKTIARVKPMLLIVDYELPGITAIELCDRIHTMKQLESIPTIMINSHTRSWSERQSYSIRFLRKPFHLETLYKAVRKALAASVDPVEGPPLEPMR